MALSVNSVKSVKQTYQWGAGKKAAEESNEFGWKCDTAADNDEEQTKWQESLLIVMMITKQETKREVLGLDPQQSK